MIPGAVFRSPGIYLEAEENPGKPIVDEGFATSHLLKWVPYLQMRLVDRTARQQGRRKGRMKVRGNI